MALSQRSQLISLYAALIKCWNNQDAKARLDGRPDEVVAMARELQAVVKAQL